MKRLTILILIAGAAAAFGAFGDVISSFPTPANNTNGLAWDGTYLWSVYSPGGGPVGHYFHRINAGNGSVVSSFYMEPVVMNENALGLAARPPDTLYATIRMNTRLVCLSTTGSILWTYQSAVVYPGPGLSYDGTYFWATNNLSNTTIRFQTYEPEIISSFTPPFTVSEMEYNNENLFITSPGTFYKMTTTGSILMSHAIPAYNGCTYGAGYIWVGGSYIYKIDPGQTGVEPASFGRVKAVFR